MLSKVSQTQEDTHFFLLYTESTLVCVCVAHMHLCAIRVEEEVWKE